MNSMTGFGKSEICRDNRRIRVEIKSVNHRFLDCNIRMPRFLLFLEDELRKVIASRICRGRIEVFVNYSSDRDDAKTFAVNKSLVRDYYKAAMDICSELNLKQDISVIDLLKIPDAVSFEDSDNDEDAIRNLLIDTANGALDELIEARKTEGVKLVSDIYLRLDTIKILSEKISGLEQTVVDDYRTKLSLRLDTVLNGTRLVDESRLAQEVAIFADKCNITEELVRIKSHLSRFADAKCDSKPQGKNLDFIVQELNREFNTIGSKANDAEITNYVISAKAEIEKIREQIQNIE